MDLINLYSALTSLFNSPLFGIFALGAVIYFGILWVAVIVWVTRDVVHRSNNLFFQVLSILLGFTFVPGLVLYLIVRPTRTLADKYDEELERRAFLESISDINEECKICGNPLRRDFIFCPVCREQLKQLCDCDQIIEYGWQICPKCGKLTSEIGKKKTAQKKSTTKKKTVDKTTKSTKK